MFLEKPEICNLIYKNQKIRVELSIDSLEGARPVKIRFLDILSVLKTKENVDECLNYIIEKNKVYLEGGKFYTAFNIINYQKNSYSTNFLTKTSYYEVEMCFCSIIEKKVKNLNFKTDSVCLIEVCGFDNWFDFTKNNRFYNLKNKSVIFPDDDKVFEEFEWKQKGIKISIKKVIKVNNLNLKDIPKHGNFVESKYYFEISPINNNPLNFKKITDILENLRTFILVLTRKKVFIESIVLQDKKGGLVEFHDCDFKYNDKNEQNVRNSLVYPYNLEGGFLINFKKFYNYYKKNSYIVYYLLSDTLFENPSVYTFLHLFNGLEVIAENDTKCCWSNGKKIKNKKDRLDYYMDKFNYIEIFKNWKINSERINEARDFYTHGLKKKKPFDVDDEFFAVLFMRCLLEHIFLSKIGFSKKNLKSLWSKEILSPMYWNYERGYSDLTNCKLK
jgi:ApeA N-terminal domain 1